jgi:hypothetical protein
MTHSVTQNLSDGLRAVVMAGVGCELFAKPFTLFVPILTRYTVILLSGRHVLPIANVDDLDACRGTSCIYWSGMYHTFVFQQNAS